MFELTYAVANLLSSISLLLGVLGCAIGFGISKLYDSKFIDVLPTKIGLIGFGFVLSLKILL